MATYTANAAQAGIQPKGLRVGLVAVTGFYSFGAASLSIATTVQMVKIPKGATPVFIQASTTQAGQYQVAIGDGNAVERYRSDATLSLGQGVVFGNVVGHPYTYSVDDTIDMLVSAVSVSTLGGAFYLTAIYSMDIQGN